MKAPPVRYVTTSDNVSIAYTTIGDGMPIIRTPPCTFSHLVLEWDNPGFRSFYEGLCARRQLVSYDLRGHGLSQRDAIDFSREIYLRDLEAVVSALPERPVVLLGQWVNGVAAVDYAAKYPDDVAALILWNPPGNDGGTYDAWYNLLKDDWQQNGDLMTLAMTRGTPPDAANAYREMALQSVERDAAINTICANAKLLSANPYQGIYRKVQHPTLVLYRRDAHGANQAHAAARAIPGVREVPLAGTAAAPWAGPTQPIVDAIDTFLADVLPNHAVRPAAPSNGTITPRECEVIRLVAAGRTNPEVAGALGISPGTVKRHVSNILNKTELKNRTELAAYAITNGLTD